MFRILAAGLLLASTAAAAQDGTIGPSTIPGDTQSAKLVYIAGVLEQMDTNGDGVITLSEWLAYGGGRRGFELLDTNKDDILTLQELRSNADKLAAFADFQAAPVN
jgi:hypothetical protein